MNTGNLQDGASTPDVLSSPEGRETQKRQLIEKMNQIGPGFPLERRNAPYLRLGDTMEKFGESVVGARPVLFIAGLPGAGKSYLVEQYIEPYAQLVAQESGMQVQRFEWDDFEVAYVHSLEEEGRVIDTTKPWKIADLIEVGKRMDKEIARAMRENPTLIPLIVKPGGTQLTVPQHQEFVTRPYGSTIQDFVAPSENSPFYGIKSNVTGVGVVGGPTMDWYDQKRDSSQGRGAPFGTRQIVHAAQWALIHSAIENRLASRYRQLFENSMPPFISAIISVKTRNPFTNEDRSNQFQELERLVNMLKPPEESVTLEQIASEDLYPEGSDWIQEVMDTYSQVTGLPVKMKIGGGEKFSPLFLGYVKRKALEVAGALVLKHTLGIDEMQGAQHATLIWNNPPLS